MSRAPLFTQCNDAAAASVRISKYRKNMNTYENIFRAVQKFFLQPMIFSGPLTTYLMMPSQFQMQNTPNSVNGWTVGRPDGVVKLAMIGASSNYLAQP